MINIIKKYKYLIIINLIIIGFLLYIIYYLYSDIPIETVKEDTVLKEEVIVDEYYYVDIKGAVLNPNVYKVKSDLRVIDVILLAGGLKSNADTSIINLSKKVTDEMTIIIYTTYQINKAKERLNPEPTIVEVIKEVEKECICIDSTNDACINEVVEEETSTLININTATKKQLMTITGIGDKKADDIITYRNTKLFNVIEDIKNVSGIGDATFEKIKSLITV